MCIRDRVYTWYTWYQALFFDAHVFSNREAHVVAPGFDNQDAAWAQDSGGTETTLEEWQWVEDPESGGYYYNSVTVRLLH